MGAPQQVLASLGAAFSPLQITGLKLWLDATVGTNQTVGGVAAVADADPVGEWLDQSGNGNHVAQATSTKRGTLKLVIQNSKSVVRFDAVDDFLAIASMVTFPSKRGTIFVVCQSSNLSAKTILGTFPAGSPSWQWTLTNAVGNRPIAWYDDVSVLNIEADSAQSLVWNVHCVTRDSNTNLAYRRNGVAQAGSTIADNQPNSAAMSLGGNTAGGEVFPGDFAEILLYDAALTAPQIAQVEAYLTAKWMPVPRQIAGLKLWLNPDVGVLQTSGGAAAVADADPVGEWQDQSGLLNHAGQVTSTKRGTLKLATQNGKNTVLFDGVDDFLATPSVAHGIGTGDFWWIGAVKAPATGETAMFSIPTTAPAFYISSLKLRAWWGAYLNFDTTLTADGFYVIEVMRTSGTIKGYINGAQEATTHAVAMSMADGIAGIGSETPGGSATFNSNMGQQLFYAGSPTAQQRAALINYLGAYYGVTVTP